MINERNKLSGLGLLIAIGLIAGLFLLGYELSKAVVAFKELNREVVVKGLAEREVPADIAIWPIQFSVSENDIKVLTSEIKQKNSAVIQFLKKQGFTDDEISTSPLSITDKADNYYDSKNVTFRYTSQSTITLYTKKIDAVLKSMKKVSDLGENGIAIQTDGYRAKAQFLFTKLNDIKPVMLDEAIENAREAAEKFAKQSNSRLGRIRSASQGVFSVEDRDRNTPYIKRVRVVSTLTYYLIN